MWMDVKKNSLKSNNHNFLLIGDSRAKAGFKPNSFDTNNINSINLAIGGATPIEGFYTLKRYLDNNRPKYLLLSYGPFHLERQDTYWNRTVKFDYLGIFNNIKVTKYAKELNEYKLLNRGNKFKQHHFYSYLNYRYNPFTYLPEFKATLFNKKLNRKTQNKKVLAVLKESKGHYFFGRKKVCHGLNSESKSKRKFKISKLLELYLIKIIELAKIYNIEVYYYTMPFNQTSYKKTSNLYKTSYDIYFNNLSTKYSIKILNKLYYLDDTNFGDVSHLYHGADIVTNDIKDKFINKLKQH
ncbi:MAG: hypothetical protein COB02_01110 [Candidatus Cloacimonadota bacterium]|nr:MAG: hypothetical protein COB02_01110 [Candidatus Cloacimonadota bacterium]